MVSCSSEFMCFWIWGRDSVVTWVLARLVKILDTAAADMRLYSFFSSLVPGLDDVVDCWTDDRNLRYAFWVEGVWVRRFWNVLDVWRNVEFCWAVAELMIKQMIRSLKAMVIGESWRCE